MSRASNIAVVCGRFIGWLLWDFSGLRFIWGKKKPPVHPSTNVRLPATFLLWLTGLYAACFGIASQRFENSVDRIESRTNALLVQLANKETRENALRRISTIQNMKVPQEPDIWSPINTFRSLFFKKTELYKPNVGLLKETVEDFKFELWDVDLRGAYLQEANLCEADLRKANLQRANLQGANLCEADLQWADLHEANLQGANLYMANLVRTKSITIEQLCEAKTLHKAQLNPGLMAGIKKTCPEVLEFAKVEE